MIIYVGNYSATKHAQSKRQQKIFITYTKTQALTRASRISVDTHYFYSICVMRSCKCRRVISIFMLTLKN